MEFSILAHLCHCAQENFIFDENGKQMVDLHQFDDELFVVSHMMACRFVAMMDANGIYHDGVPSDFLLNELTGPWHSPKKWEEILRQKYKGS